MSKEVVLKKQTPLTQSRGRLLGLTAVGALALAPMIAIPANADVDEDTVFKTSSAEDVASAAVDKPLEEPQSDPNDVSPPKVTEGSDPAPSDKMATTLDSTSCDLTVLATTDVHGHVFNWDYFTDAPYSGANELGLSRVATNVQNVRAEKGTDSVLLIDNGDAIQGTPLTYLAAVQPDRLPYPTNPMAEAFNLMGYDAQVLGNHEFNYGLTYLNDYRSQLNAPLLGANVLDYGTTNTAFQPYEIFEKNICGETVKVGVIGVVTPGVRVWDKAHVEGVLEFRDLVEAAREWVPVMKQQGAEIIIVSAHTGEDPGGVEWNPADLGENLASSIATLVPGIDMVIAGHSHVNISSRAYTGAEGQPVLLTQPYYWARSAANVTLPIGTTEAGEHFVDWPDGTAEVEALAQPLVSADVSDSSAIVDNPVLSGAHQAAINYVKQVIAYNEVEMTTDTSRYEDTPILDLIGYVQTQRVSEAMQGTEYEDLTVLSQVSPFSRTSIFREGDLTVADVAGLYIYDNTLGASLLDGAQLRAYLEHSARYFVQVTEDDPWNPETHSGAMYDGMTRPIPDYNFDAITGVNYRLDVTKPVGERVVDLQFVDGTPVRDSDQFVMAINNYRQNGGGGYPVQDFANIWDGQLEIRQLIIDYAESVGVISPVNFFVENWSLITTIGSEEETAPSLTVEPQTVKAGDSVLAWGENWVSDEEIILTLGSDAVTRAVGSETEVLGTATAGEDGTFEAVLTIPTKTATASYVLVATQGDVTVTVPLEVTAGATDEGGETDKPATPGDGSDGSLPDTGATVLIVLVAAGAAMGLGIAAKRKSTQLR